MNRRLRNGIIAAALAALAATAALWFEANRYLGDSLPAGGDFTLQSASGPLSLRSFRGKGVVLYFGYTSCPDACPTSLSRLATIMKKLSPGESARIVPLFISVDSRADTPKKTDDYAKFFFTDGVGLTGSRSEIDRVVKQYGTSYIYVEDKGSALGYSIQHGTDFYFIGPKGDLRAVAPTQSDADDLLRDLRSIL